MISRHPTSRFYVVDEGQDDDSATLAVASWTVMILFYPHFEKMQQWYRLEFSSNVQAVRNESWTQDESVLK
jgi:hypothetical protein